MKSVAIATNKPDKFDQIAKIFTSLKIPSNNFLNLTDLQIKDSPYKSGGVI